MPEYKARRPNRAPSHPGGLLYDALPALDLSVAQAAAVLSISRQALHNVMSGKSAISPTLALKLGKLCGNGPEIWLAMQNSYDLWHTRKAIQKDLDRIPERPAAS